VEENQMINFKGLRKSEVPYATFHLFLFSALVLFSAPQIPANCSGVLRNSLASN
jgi:hypothetical protein